jgi:hypothetical protein
MKCPNCSLENHPSAMLCDCGYNFETKMKKDNKKEEVKVDLKEHLLKILQWGLAGAIAYTIMFLIQLLLKK